MNEDGSGASEDAGEKMCVHLLFFFVSDEGCELAVLTSVLQSLPLTNGLDQTVAR